MPLSRSIFLTFDDGPEPEVTLEVLRILKDHKALATFFCLGQQIEKYPDLFRQIVESGHSVGNHTYSHIDAWKEPALSVIEEIDRTNQLMEQIAGVRARLYRPPHGRLCWSVWWRCRHQFRHVMWDVNGQDYLPNLNSDSIMKGISKHARGGSIILLHDNREAKDRVLSVLPRILGHYQSQGFSFHGISK